VKEDITIEIIQQQVCEKWSELTETIPSHIEGIHEKIKESRLIYDSATASIQTSSDGFEELCKLPEIRLNPKPRQDLLEVVNMSVEDRWRQLYGDAEYAINILRGLISTTWVKIDGKERPSPQDKSVWIDDASDPGLRVQGERPNLIMMMIHQDSSILQGYLYYILYTDCKRMATFKELTKSGAKIVSLKNRINSLIRRLSGIAI
jgi:hypothetical protein